VLRLTVLQYFAQADKMRDLRKRPAAPTTPPQGDDASGQSLAQQVAAGLRELADKVEAQPELISKASDLMSLDFMDSRAPPSEVRRVSRFTARLRVIQGKLFDTSLLGCCRSSSL